MTAATEAGCPRCGARPTIGVLCATCAAAVAPCPGLLREHLVATATEAADAWLVDGFGAAHPVAATGCRIGRSLDRELALLHASVSREHCELTRTSAGWQLRDLGSRNGTRLDGRRLEGRVRVPGPTTVVVGEVRLWFVDRALGLRAGAPAAATTHASGGEPRFHLRAGERELCVLAGGAGGGGAVLHRRADEAAWAELGLSPLELQLLRALCAQALAEADSPSRSRGCVATRQLAAELPFQSAYADDENVRQVVRRLRTALDRIGACGVIESVQGRGYYVAWSVTAT